MRRYCIGSCFRKRRMAGTGKSNLTMQHQQVIENFVKNGTGGRGTYLKADEDVLYSKFPENYRPYGRYDGSSGETTPLAVRLGDESLLVNGAGFWGPVGSYQMDILRNLRHTPRKFGVIPFHSVVAAWTDGEVRDWNQAPIPTSGER